MVRSTQSFRKRTSKSAKIPLSKILLRIAFVLENIPFLKITFLFFRKNIPFLVHFLSKKAYPWCWHTSGTGNIVTAGGFIPRMALRMGITQRWFLYLLLRCKDAPTQIKFDVWRLIKQIGYCLMVRSKESVFNPTKKCVIKTNLIKQVCDHFKLLDQAWPAELQWLVTHNNIILWRARPTLS